jgi:hypothetical protein
MKKILKRIRFMHIKGLNKARAAVKLFWLFLSLAVIFGVLAVIMQLFAKPLFGWESTVHRELREIELLSSIRSISINSADIPLEVYTYDGDKIIVEYIGESALIIDEDELELKISRVEDFMLSLYSIDILNYKMTVRLPAETYREIKLTTASGEITARNIHTELLSITSRTGNINLYAIEGLITASTRQGDVYAEFINFADVCSIETDSGSVTVLMPERIEVNLSFFTDTGRLTSDFFRREYHAHEGDLYLKTGVNPLRFTVRTGSADLHFHKRNEIIN